MMQDDCRTRKDVLLKDDLFFGMGGYLRGKLEEQRQTRGASP